MARNPQIPSLPSDGKNDPLLWNGPKPVGGTEFAAPTGYRDPNRYQGKIASRTLPTVEPED